MLVKSGERTNLRIELTLSTVTESITVTAESPIIDVTTATSGQDITLELTESLDAAAVEFYDPAEYAWDGPSETEDYSDEDLDAFSFLDWGDDFDVDQLEVLRATLGS